MSQGLRQMLASAPAWLMIVAVSLLGIIGMLAVVVPSQLAMVWIERKFIARLQVRYGPNRAGPFGWLQPIADAIKLLAKEDLTPAGADRLVFKLAPIGVMIPAL